MDTNYLKTLELSPSSPEIEEDNIKLEFSLPKDRLTELLAKITPENCHGEISTGLTVGAEEW